MASARKFSVGQRIWKFDMDRRVYSKPIGGMVYGDIIFSEHFRELKIVGISGKSYLIGWPDGSGGKKVGFKKAEAIYYYDQGREDQIWIDDHRVKMLNLLGSCKDADVLRAVATILGYEPVRSVPSM